MKIIPNLIQGSAAWHEHRRMKWNASEAPAMLGESPYMSRSEFIRRRATGIEQEVDGATQKRFDKGHAVEKLLIQVAIEHLGEPLHPFVAVADFDERYSASFDGCTFIGDVTAECKLLNERLRAAFADMETMAPHHRERESGRCLPVDYRIQCEQQLRVAEAERCLFLTGELRDDGTLGDTFSCWYYPDDALWAHIQAGWPQFEQDCAAYVPTESTSAAVAAPVESLPAVSVRMDGSIAVVSNLDVFGAALRAFVAKIPAKPTSDQEFADADAACKALKRAEEALDGAEQNALGQVQSVETLTRTIGDLRSVARTARLATEKLVKARKEQIRAEEVQRGREALSAHIAALDNSLGRPLMPPVVADFAGAISGKKTLDSLRNAVDTELARAKIAANEAAERIRANLMLLDAQPAHLFRDLTALVHKQPDDLQAVIAARLAEEERRQEAERARIRAEEAERLEREAAERRRQEDEAALRESEALAAQGARAEREAIQKAQDAAQAQRAQTPAPNVRPLVRPTAPPAVPPSLKLGEINRRIAPLSIDAAGLALLGFTHDATEKSDKLYHESQFQAICLALIEHIEAVAQQRAAA